MRPELDFLLPFVYKEYKFDYFCGVKCIIWRKITLEVNEIIPNMTSSHKTSILDNSSKNTKLKKKSF